MIFGIGIDIIETERVIKKIAKGNGLKEYIFSENEILYCEKMTKQGEHFAGRFAAKEAFIKALGIGLTKGLHLNEIEIKNDNSGKPYFELHGIFESLIKEKEIINIHLSISHLKSTACAMVVLEQ